MEELLTKEFLKLKAEVAALIEQVDTSKTTHLQNYLYFIHFPLFSFTESIIVLCKNKKSHSAKVLLRCLVEAHINIIYHQLNDSERRLAVSAKSGFDTRTKDLNQLQDLIKKYPNLESKDPANLFSTSWLEQAKQRTKEQRQSIIRGNNLEENDQDLDLKSKAIRCDQEFTGNADKGHFERMYNLIYRQLSPATHLNVEGLQVFVNQDETGEYLFSDGDDGKFIISEAIGICLAFTKDLYETGVIKGEMLDTVSTLEKLNS